MKQAEKYLEPEDHSFCFCHPQWEDLVGHEASGRILGLPQNSKTFALSKTLVRKLKGKAHTGRKYFQNTHVKKDSHPEYKKLLQLNNNKITLFKQRAYVHKYFTKG